MPVTHLLDTSVYCQPLRKKPLGPVRQRWDSLGDHRLCVSVICEAELRQGLEAKQSRRLWRDYDRILRGRLPILDITLPVAEAYGRLAGQMMRDGKRRPELDLLIAATAQVHGIIVATCNYRHFAGMEGIAVEDWSAASL